MSGSPFSVGSAPVDVTVDPSGTFVYVANFSGNSVSVFSINTSNSLSPVGTATAGTNPNSVVTTQ